MGLRWVGNPLTETVEILRTFRIGVTGWGDDLEAHAWVAPRLAVSHATEQEPPTLGASNLPAHIALSWPSSGLAIDVPLRTWSGYVADGLHQSPRITIEVATGEDACTVAVTHGSDIATWLDGERVPMWGVLTERDALSLRRPDV